MLPLWILLLCFYCGGVRSVSSSSLHPAPHIPESLDLQVEYGQSAILPCDGSSYLEDDGGVQWEAMGEDVVTLQGEELKVGDRFTGRVHFASEEKRKEGDWSVVVERLRFSDTNMYECIWQGRRTLSTVWLTVTPPEVEDSLVVSVGDDVILQCYIDVSRIQSPEDLLVWWERNNTMIIQKKEEVSVSSDGDSVVYSPTQNDFSEQTDFTETFHVHMRPKTVDDSGEYRCWYKTRRSDDPRPGTPQSITVTVLEPNHEETGFEMTDHFETTTETAETMTDLTPVLLDDATQPVEVITEPQPMEAFDETVTSFPDDHSPDTWSESVQWDSFPWVRTGLIAGVLLTTAVVLCILRALRKV
ncbi:uncharacterized protein LOC115434066 [Sphaeramia orbicularis]|uniref:uncharacterized protein LOC115434066 n=1 Tax=Sphaeramia orbicularis TaxID=375764 RepID=UPI00117C9FDA|nr:uncharacterized protein LOC115434066 [Sphaeramia orbicularis]